LGIPDEKVGGMNFRILKLEKALREIDTSATLPDNFDPAEWWKHVASKRREIAIEALKDD
jgi:hypothetical protein